MRKRNSVAHYEERYHLVTGEREPMFWRCVYCGLPAESKDHVPPITRVSDYESLGLAIELYIKVPCCLECNNLLGAELQDSFFQRAEVLKDKLARKYRRHLNNVDWDDEELEELGPTLKSKVLEGKVKSQRVLARIEYYAGVDLVMDWIQDRL
jgi:hypothetical protein